MLLPTVDVPRGTFNLRPRTRRRTGARLLLLLPPRHSRNPPIETRKLEEKRRHMSQRPFCLQAMKKEPEKQEEGEGGEAGGGREETSER